MRERLRERLVSGEWALIDPAARSAWITRPHGGLVASGAQAGMKRGDQWPDECCFFQLLVAFFCDFMFFFCDFFCCLRVFLYAFCEFFVALCRAGLMRASAIVGTESTRPRR